MANILELENETPYNIVKVDGVWYFAVELFNSVGAGGNSTLGQAMPKSLRVVPKELVPDKIVVKNGKQYGYVAEGKIVKHFNSPAFQTAAVRAGVSNGYNISSAGGMTVSNIASSVQANVARLDPVAREQRYSVTSGLVASNEKSTLNAVNLAYSGPATDAKDRWSMSPTNASVWGILDTVQKSGRSDSFGADANSAMDMIVQRNELNYLVLPDEDSGVITEKSAMSEDVFAQAITAQSAADIRRDQEMLVKAGYLSAGSYIPGVADGNYVRQMLDVARQVSFSNLSYFNSDKENLKPIKLNEFLKDLAKQGSKGRTTTSSSTSFFSLSEGEARSLLESFYADAVGRRPSDKEVNMFKDAVQREARKNPNVSSSSTYTDAQGNSSSTTTTKDGYQIADAQMGARDQAEKEPDSNAFLTSTKYFDAFINALRGPLG
jgi:hypothetical protein